MFNRRAEATKNHLPHLDCPPRSTKGCHGEKQMKKTTKSKKNTPKARKIKAASVKPKANSKSVICYMDATDFFHELGEARGGNRVYGSLEEVLLHQPCAVECGVVRVQVTQGEVVRESNFDWEGGQREAYHRLSILRESLEKAEKALVYLRKEIAKIEATEAAAKLDAIGVPE